jgi:hypothetical protein
MQLSNHGAKKSFPPNAVPRTSSDDDLVQMLGRIFLVTHWYKILFLTIILDPPKFWYFTSFEFFRHLMNFIRRNFRVIIVKNIILYYEMDISLNHVRVWLYYWNTKVFRWMIIQIALELSCRCHLKTLNGCAIYHFFWSGSAVAFRGIAFCNLSNFDSMRSISNDSTSNLHNPCLCYTAWTPIITTRWILYDR